jgi:putative colanic acid biosynthesis UDP-glucose lipid carrier transferase
VQRAFSWRYAVVKRTIDILLSSMFIILFLPVMLVVAIAVAVSSPGPIFYRQERLGRFGMPFRIIKFRSMYTTKHKNNVLEINGQHHRKNEAAYPLNKESRDPRITPVGRIIRKLSLDELPQLFNVLLGDMSLVGPRPHAVAHNEQYAALIDDYLGRHRVQPGITGWAQVNGRAALPWDERIELDLFYVEHRSLALDLRIIARSMRMVLTGRGLYKGETGGWQGTL